MREFASVWLVVISLLITAMPCNLVSASDPAGASQDGNNIVEVTGTVIYLTFEGGFWGIVGDDGEYYLPLNLPQELQSEGLRAEFELEILEDVVTIYMWGIAVNVLDYGEALGAAYILTVSNTLGGFVTMPAEWVSSYAPGTVIDLVARPSIGYRFVNWSGDVDTIANVNAASTTITMNDDYSVAANFEVVARVNQYGLTISSTDGGSVTAPGEGTSHYNSGTLVNLAAVAADGYQFVNWTGDTDTIANVSAESTTITVNNDYSITANFDAIALVNQCDLSVSSTDGGSVTTPGEGVFTYNMGTVVDLVANPDKGHHFVDWTGDVASIDDVNASAINMTVEGDYTIMANFRRSVNPTAVGGAIAAVVTAGLLVFFLLRRRIGQRGLTP